jgi:hypothetical protein
MAETLDEYNARMNAQAQAAWNARCPPPPEVAMPNFRTMRQSKYLSKEELATPVRVTIRNIQRDSFNNQGAGQQTAWVMYFNEMPKGLKLNNTNLDILAAAFGEESDHWIGRAVRLYVDRTVRMAGQIVGGIRIQAPKAAMGGPVPAAGWPGTGAPAGARFDPMTGAPLQTQPVARFDPMTGAPLETVNTATGEIHQPYVKEIDQPAGRAEAEEFDDDIPF